MKEQRPCVKALGIVLFPVLNFVLPLITQQYLCGNELARLMFTLAFFFLLRSDFCYLAFSLVWPGPKGVRLKKADSSKNALSEKFL